MKISVSLKDKYLNMSAPVKAVFWFTICRFVQQGVNMLIMPLVTRLLSTQEYGIVVTFNSWKGILLFVLVLAVFQAIMNLCVKYSDHDAVASGIMSLASVISLVWLLLFFVFDDKISVLMDMPKPMIICLLLQTSFQAIVTCWNNTMQYDYKYRGIVAVTLFTSIIAPVVGLIFVIFVSKTAMSIILPQVVVWGVTLVVVLANSYSRSKTFFHFEMWKYALGFSVPLLPHYFSETILQSSDRIMIGKIVGEEAVAIYGIAYTIGNIIMIIASVINSAFAPYQYHMIQEKRYKELAKNTNIILFGLACILCLIMLFAKEIVLFFGGTKYLGSVSSIMPISLGVFFYYIFQLFARVQEYYGQKYTIVIASIASAILNIVLNYIFIPLYGFIAASYTTFVCFLILCILHYNFYRMVCKKNLGHEIYDMKGIVGIGCFSIVVGFLINIVAEYWYIKYSILLVSIVVAYAMRGKMIDIVKKLKE